MEQQSQQDPPATGRALDGEVDETLWYARSCTCGTIIDVLSALEVAPTKGGVGPQAAVEISEEAGLQIRVLEGATLHGAASLKPSLFEEWTCTFAEQAQTRPTPHTLSPATGEAAPALTPPHTQYFPTDPHVYMHMLGRAARVLHQPRSATGLPANLLG